MNITIQLFQFLRMATGHQEIKPPHVFLYLLLIEKWDSNLYGNPFYVHRSEIMHLAKIKSNRTFHRYMVDLRFIQLIEYEPMGSNSKVAKVSINKLSTSTFQTA